MKRSAIKTFNHKPYGQFIHLNSGIYRFDCYGARGGTGMTDGNGLYPGGNGAHISALMIVQTSASFYLFIGSHGKNANPASGTIAPGGWNGGGNGGPDTRDNDGSGGGGGATDVRLINGTYNDSISLNSRILVAAGGSGSAFQLYGAPGGNQTGFKTITIQSPSFVQSTNTTQTKGYKPGQGESGKPHACVPSSGGGGGYMGGISLPGMCGNADVPWHYVVSDSGSSFINETFFMATHQQMNVGGNTDQDDGFISIQMLHTLPFSMKKVTKPKRPLIFLYHVFYCRQ